MQITSQDHEHEHDHHHAEDKMDWGRVQGWVQTVIMFLMGLYFIDLSLPDGNLGNYINLQNFGWLTWVGAAILLAAAAINAFDLLRSHEADHHHHDHDHGTVGSLSSWIFLGVVSIPLILGLSVPSKPLGADAISEISADVRSIGFNSPSNTVAIPAEKRNLLDWVRAFASSTDLKEFEGEPVDLIGFVYRDARFAGTENFMLVRFTISCCVADARPLGLVVENPGQATLADDTWVQVKGKIEIRNFDGVDTPIIVAESIQVTPQPEQPYLYL